MADYKNMYKTLFVSISQAIEVLQKAQIEAEELYIKSCLNEVALYKDYHKAENKKDKQS